MSKEKVNPFVKYLAAIVALAGATLLFAAGPYNTDSPADLSGLTLTDPADSESAQYGASAIRQLKRHMLRFGTNEHYFTGAHKTNFISSHMYGTNSIPYYAYQSNSIPSTAISNVTTITGASLQRYRTNINTITTNSSIFPRSEYYITNGTQVASITISPQNSNAVITLRTAIHGKITGTGNGVAGIFVTSNTNQLGYTTFGKDGNNVVNHYMEIEVAAVTTNSRTYTLRVGPYKNSGVVYLNLNPDDDPNTNGVTFFEAQEWTTD